MTTDNRDSVDFTLAEDQSVLLFLYNRYLYCTSKPTGVTFRQPLASALVVVNEPASWAMRGG